MTEPASTASADATTLRVAAYGLGRTGRAHAALLAVRRDASLVALGDPDPQAARIARGLGFDAPVFGRLERLLAVASPQVLALGVPPRDRARAVRLALEAGVAVLVEPPLAFTLEMAEALLALSQERGVPLAVAHTLPFEPTFAHALDEVAAGALGAVRLARSSIYASRVFSTRDARARAESPGGVLTCAGLDLLLVLDALFGAPGEVRCTASRLYGGHEDEAHAMMTLANGVEVGLDASWSVPGYPVPAAVIEAEGENGMLLVSDEAFECEWRTARAGRAAGHQLVRDTELPQRARYDLDGEAREPMLAAFLAWVTGGPAPVHAAPAAVRAHKTLEALYSSSRRGGTPVRVGGA